MRENSTPETAGGLLRHPRQLYLLFFTEMWERFSFYGMKALLLAYMVTHLKFDESKGYALLGAYAALVYTMPVFGGMVADRLLGYRKAILFGGMIMAAGHLVLALPAGWSLFAGMALIICGNGFFKPNISGMVGRLYAGHDPRRDSGFSIFYMGINIGAALGGSLCGWLAYAYGWHYGFGLAGVMMMAGLAVFYLGRRMLGGIGAPPDEDRLKAQVLPWLSREWTVYLVTLAVVPVVILLFNYYRVMDFVMLILAVMSLVYLVYEASRLAAEERNRLFAATAMITFSILFWAFYEQNGGALNLFAMRNVDMHLWGRALPALSVNNFLPPAWVVVLSPVFAWMWTALSRRGREPSTPMKFALSFVLLGMGFLVFFLGTRLAEEGLIPLAVFAAGYFFLICGELCISPIGLSMITKLSPQRMVGMVMGIWFLASALGDFLSAKIGSLMIVPESVAGDPVRSLPYYSHILQQIGWVSAGVGLVLMLTVPLLRKWMGGIH